MKTIDATTLASVVMAKKTTPRWLEMTSRHAVDEAASKDGEEEGKRRDWTANEYWNGRYLGWIDFVVVVDFVAASGRWKAKKSRTN